MSLSTTRVEREPSALVTVVLSWMINSSYSPSNVANIAVRTKESDNCARISNSIPSKVASCALTKSAIGVPFTILPTVTC